MEFGHRICDVELPLRTHLLSSAIHARQVTSWMTEKVLTLNSSKTEFHLIGLKTATCQSTWAVHVFVKSLHASFSWFYNSHITSFPPQFSSSLTTIILQFVTVGSRLAAAAA